MKRDEGTHAVTLGIFLLVGIAIFVGALFMIGGKQSFFTDTFTLRGEFKTVAGLREGAAVRMLGINVGTVKTIQIAGGNKVLVEMAIENSARPFIKNDSKMSITTEGLVGNKIIAIEAGSDIAPPVTEYGYLPTQTPFNPEDMFRRLKETGDNTARISAQLDSIISRVNSGRGTLGKLINDESLYDAMDSTMRGLAATFGQVDDLIHRITNRVDSVAYTISAITERLNSNKTVVGTILTDTTFASNMKRIIQDAQYAVENAQEGTRSFAQNMEALKHNFLFKGYFEDIGYWDKSRIETRRDSLAHQAEQLRTWEARLQKEQHRLNGLQDSLNVRLTR